MPSSQFFTDSGSKGPMLAKFWLRAVEAPGAKTLGVHHISQDVIVDPIIQAHLGGELVPVLIAGCGVDGNPDGLSKDEQIVDRAAGT